MLHLYHSPISVCSMKVRVGLAETGVEWEDTILDLNAQEQKSEDFLALNPEGVVPVIVNNGMALRESSALLAYINRLSAKPSLMPEDTAAYGQTQMWLVRCIEIHAAINTLTFATFFRAMEQANSTAEKTEAKLARIGNPQIAAKRRDLFQNGPASVYFSGALHTLTLMLSDMNRSLETTKWLVADSYSLSDIALLAYVDRIERLGLADLWNTRYPTVGRWLSQSRERPSYQTAIVDYLPKPFDDGMRKFGALSLPAVLEAAGAAA